MGSWLARPVLVIGFVVAGTPLMPVAAEPPVTAAEPPITSAQPLVTSAETIRDCLCLKKSVAEESEQLSARGKNVEESRREADSLDAQVAAGRSKVDTTDPAAVEAFRALLARRDAAMETLKTRLIPIYGVFVDRYNKRVQNYNTQCDGQSFDSAALKQVQENLSCPALMGQPFLPPSKAN